MGLAAPDIGKEKLIDLQAAPIRSLLGRLLEDKTTGENILFATDAYAGLGAGFAEKDTITPEKLTGYGKRAEIRPRVEKAAEAQQARTRKKAEVFTPSWIVNKMNNHCDAAWFGKENLFNIEQGQSWVTKKEPIPFAGKKTWQSYVDTRRLEITCGEAPYIVSRYDATTGEKLPPERRIGLLDRKLRVVNENAADDEEWLRWTGRAFESCYGYEFQGDNLLLARVNLLLTFADYYEARFHTPPEEKLLRKFANIICWNFWQMDGLTGTVPFTLPDTPEEEQLTFFSWEEEGETATPDLPAASPCRVNLWRQHRSVSYDTIRGGKQAMKWDFAIGNPPYQEETHGENKSFAPPVYDRFLDSAFEIADAVEMIHPARFLFNAGSTPKAWNEKMLSDTHFKVLYSEQDSSKIFPNTDIKGGVAITYYDERKDFGEIGTFTPFRELNTILHKVISDTEFSTFSQICISRTAYRLTQKLHDDYPEAITQLSKGHAFDMSTNIFDRLPQVFYEEKPADGNQYIQILGRIGTDRVYRYIRKDYVNMVKNLEYYKVFLANANGCGALGETMSTPLIGTPLIGNTESFISIGTFDSLFEAKSTLKYVKSKFARCLLGVLKVTQHITPETWKYVPLQNFTPSSDIDWSVSIPDIDRQLYKKYGLSPEEIDFIEKNVKEME